jgi:hypothetical protein
MGHHSIQSKVTKGVHADAETGKGFSFSNFVPCGREVFDAGAS